MRKRLISFIMVLSVLVSLSAIPAAAVSSSEYQTVKNSVSNTILGFAKQINRANADDDAFTDFFVHGFFGNGAHMTLNDQSATTVALFNSCVMQEALIATITESIVMMQDLNETTGYAKGSVGWHNFYYNYGFYAYRDGSFAAGTRVKQLVNTKYTYGTNHYQGAVNENDSVMELIAGSIVVSYTLQQTENTEDKRVYRLDLKFSDSFDFDEDYGNLADKGYDTSKDDRLNDIGKLFTYFGIDEFLWDYSKTLRIELPNSCSHTSGSYRWVYNAVGETMTNDTTNGYTSNSAERKVYKTTSTDADGNTTETVKEYYGLERTVHLRYDKPWVVEVEQLGLSSIQFGAPDTSSSTYDTFYLYSKSHIWLFHYDYRAIPDPNGSSGQKTVSDGHYVGAAIQSSAKYSKKHTYVIRLENVIEENGKNMIYATIYDRDLDQVIFGPEAMDDHWIKYNGESSRTLVDTASDYCVGKDFYINYIGNKKNSYPLSVDRELRIWENGKDSPSDSVLNSAQKAPTCTEQGATVYTCRDCGCSFERDFIPPLGHSYGEYLPDNNAACATNSTQTRVCTVCGEKESVEIPNTALGHSFGEYVYDNNAGCTADGTRTRKCTVCGEAETISAPDTAAGHDYKANVTPPTYTEQGYTTYTCAVCGDSYKADYTDVKQHSYVPVITVPTCTEQGYTTYTCSECGDSYKADYTDLAEHTPVVDPAVAPTCVEKGKTEGSHCGVCGLVLKKQAAISVVNTHRMEESIVKMPTYEEAGQVAYICKDCGKTDYMEVPPLTKPERNNPFTDVSESDWFYDPVLWAVENNVTGGKTATTFAPNEGCTRAQVVTFLWAANGKPEPKSMNNPFVDVPSNAWYLKSVLWAVEQGITGGVSADKFGPDQTCTRAQIATFLWAAMGKPAAMSGSEFVDVTAADWYATPIIWAKEQGITGGIGNGMFGPNNTCTRAQVVTFLNKVYQK